jgi:DNA polymerase I
MPEVLPSASGAVLLIDGMGLLMRSIKASARMKRLSSHGTDTTALTAFTGSLVRILTVQHWTHAVVCWEGIRAQNWRLEVYPAYKAQRAASRAEAGDAETLAREFCHAAGLHQNSSPSFEGDDVIAAYWRMFRKRIPGATVTILTSDKDLWQLIDPYTVCRDPADDWLTDEAGVEIKFGCRPSRLPLLRALAGDVSDGIPGIKGMGIMHALAFISKSEPPLQIIHSLPVPSEVRELTEIYYRISNLHAPEMQLVLSSEEEELALWSPMQHGKEMAAFLLAYDMRRLLSRIDAGVLPWPAVPLTDEIVELSKNRRG